MIDIEQTLRDRAKTHGDFSEHARVTQAIKDALRGGPSYHQANAHERETLDMLAHEHDPLRSRCVTTPLAEETFGPLEAEKDA